MFENGKQQKICQIILLWALSLMAILVLVSSLRALNTQTAPYARVVVDTLVDENDGCGVGHCSLREAIAAANSGDTIEFSVSGTIDISHHGQLTLYKDLTIDGGGKISVSGGDVTRVFYIDESHVVFENLGIINGYSEDGDGGGIYNQDGSLTVSNCTLLDNVAALGGGIESGGQLTVTDSILAGNKAVYSGGGLYFHHSGVGLVTNTVFSNNSTLGGGGGISNYGILTVTNSTLSDNTAEVGGGICNCDAYDLTIINSTLSGNSAVTGGGIANYSPMTIINSTLSGNIATGNQSSDGGGAIYQSGNGVSLTMTNSTLSGNIAPYVDNRDGIWSREGLMTVRNTIAADNGNVNCTIDGGTFNGSTANMADDSSCLGFTQVASLHLGSLQDNGGDTLTHALLSSSPAIDAGDNDACPATDQRGVVRPKGAACDIGAVEFTHDLRVFKTGTGRGTVTSEPAGIHCGDHCIANYESGTVVTLTATISHNSIFLGWSGACTGTADCVVTVDHTKTVTASFKFPYDVYLPLSFKN